MRVVPASRLSASPWMNPARWAAVPPSGPAPDGDAAGWARDRYAVALATGAGRAGAAERARAAVLAYRVFPPRRLVAAMPSLTVRPGETIVQGVRLGPLGLIAAVRVVTVFDRERDGIRRTGFAYVTLAGHPERGAMTFAVVEDQARDVATFEIDVLSRPGHWLTRLAHPITRRIQQASTREALAHIVEVASRQSPVGSDA